MATQPPTSNIIEDNFVHQVYDAISGHFSATRFAVWPKVREFIESIPPGAIVADVGCGNGKYFAVRDDWAIIGSDRSKGLAEVSGARIRSPSSSAGSRLALSRADVLVADGLRLPYRAGGFDAVLCIAVLHHISSPQRRLHMLRELLLLLRPGGRALVTVWATQQEEPKSTIHKWQPLASPAQAFEVAAATNGSGTSEGGAGERPTQQVGSLHVDDTGSKPSTATSIPRLSSHPLEQRQTPSKVLSTQPLDQLQPPSKAPHNPVPDHNNDQNLSAELGALGLDPGRDPSTCHSTQALDSHSNNSSLHPETRHNAAAPVSPPTSDSSQVLELTSDVPQTPPSAANAPLLHAGVPSIESSAGSTPPLAVSSAGRIPLVAADAGCARNGVAGEQSHPESQGADYLVPWHLPFHRAGGLSQAGGFPQSSGVPHMQVDKIKGAVVFRRYYHLFDEGELDGLVAALGDGARLVKSYYDKSNWCVVFEKVHQNMHVVM